jgi:hypothetical protein
MIVFIAMTTNRNAEIGYLGRMHWSLEQLSSFGQLHNRTRGSANIASWRKQQDAGSPVSMKSEFPLPRKSSGKRTL